MLQNATLLTSLVDMSLVLRLPRDMHLSGSSANAPRLPSVLDMLQNPHVLLTVDKMHNPLHLPCKMTSERPKVLRTRGFFTLLTWKCASRHNGVHFLDISTFKSGLGMVCFVHFDLQMCFAPQHRPLFRHPNFQKWPQLTCFVHFDLEMCLAPQRRALLRHLNFRKWSEHGVFCAF